MKLRIPRSGAAPSYGKKGEWRPTALCGGELIVSVFDHFEQSPFDPLSEHMAKVKECVLLVEPMFDFVRDRNYDALLAVTQQIFKLEHEADLIKAEIRKRIPRTFYLPIYRGDLLAYLKLQDSIADSVEDVAVGLTIKPLVLPQPLVEPTFKYVHRALSTCQVLFRCTDQLAALVEEDFEAGRVDEILTVVAEAEHAEWRADKAQFSLAQKLFALDDEMKATDIFLWSQVFRELGRMANHADNTAERLRRMLLR